MNRITLIAPNYRPESNAGAQRIASLATNLAMHEWQVTVITHLPHHPQNQIYEGYDLTSPSRRNEDGIEIIRLRPWIVPKDNLALRLLSEILFCVQAFPHLLRIPAKMIVASSPYMFLGPLGLLASRLKGAKFVWDVRDLTWLYPRAAGKRTFGLDKPLEALMRWVARRADALSTATEGLLAYFSRRPSRAIVFANGVSEGWLEQLIELRPTTPSKSPKVLYAGLLGYNQELSTLLEAAQLLPEVDFVLAGDGPERPTLEKLIDEDGIHNVTLLGYLSPEQLLEAYGVASILVAHLRGDPLHRWSQPSKVWEYMATGRPVIYAGEGEVVAIIESHDLALAIPPEQPEALAAAIRELIMEPSKAEALGARGRTFVINRRKRSTLNARFLELVESVLAEVK